MDFIRRNQVLLASGAFLVLSLVLVALNGGGRRKVDPIGAVALELARPIQGIVATGVDAVSSVWNGYLALVGVREENERLREMIGLLESERHRLQEVALENERLRNLLDAKAMLPAKARVGRVVGRDSSPFFRILTIDRGLADGIGRDMAVVHTDGVVGRVLESSQNAARILAITDHNSAVDALVQRSRARGLVEGTLEGTCLLKYVGRTESIEIGDLVITSGLDGIFPKGLRIGRITTIRPTEHDLYQVAEIEPAVAFPVLEEVLVLTEERQGGETEGEAVGGGEENP